MVGKNADAKRLGECHKDTKNIIFVCQVYHPDNSSTSQLFKPLLELMVKRGYSVSIFCGYPNNLKIPKKEIINGVTVRRLGLRGIDHKKNMFNRALAYLSYLSELFLTLLLCSNHARFIGVTNPPFNAHVMALTSMLRVRQFDYILLDLHPEGVLKLGKLSKHSVLVKLWLYFNRISYQRTNRLYAIGRDMRELISNTYNRSIDTINYMPHWSVNEGLSFVEFQNSKFTKQLEIQDKFVVQYSGNMGIWHDMETFVRAAKLLEENDKIRFLFVGDGVNKGAALKLSKDLGCKNIIWKDFVAQENLHESLSASHVSLITLREGLEGVAVPCKLYGILSSGRAIISMTPANCEIARTVEEHNCGVNIEPGNVGALAKAILQFEKNRHETLEMGRRAFKCSFTSYSLDKAFDCIVSNEQSVAIERSVR